MSLLPTIVQQQQQQRECSSFLLIFNTNNVRKWIAKKMGLDTVPYIVTITPETYHELVDYFQITPIKRESIHQFVVVRLFFGDHEDNCICCVPSTTTTTTPANQITNSNFPDIFPQYDGINYAKIHSSITLSELRELHIKTITYGKDFVKNEYNNQKRTKNDRVMAKLMQTCYLQQFSINDIEEEEENKKQMEDTLLEMDTCDESMVITQQQQQQPTQSFHTKRVERYKKKKEHAVNNSELVSPGHYQQQQRPQEQCKRKKIIIQPVSSSSFIKTLK